MHILSIHVLTFFQIDSCAKQVFTNRPSPTDHQSIVNAKKTLATRKNSKNPGFCSIRNLRVIPWHEVLVDCPTGIIDDLLERKTQFELKFCLLIPILNPYQFLKNIDDQFMSGIRMAVCLGWLQQFALLDNNIHKMQQDFHYPTVFPPQHSL